MRRKMLLGEKVCGCDQCYQQEAIGGRSKRIEMNEQWGHLIGEAIQQTSPDGKITFSPSTLRPQAQ